MRTLLVDGDNLLTIGFFGLKNCFYKGEHIGGLYHFLNTLRKSFELYNIDKICVFWDGEDGSYYRKQIYPLYKENRKGRIKNTQEDYKYNCQRIRIKQYLEELYVRQEEYQHCETDDCIAYYTQNSNENIIIYSSDRDLLQLLNNRIMVYNPSHGKLYKIGDKIEYDHEEILVENVKLVKIICGDYSDNICGIYNLGIKRLLSFYPELKEKSLTLDEILERNKLLLENDSKNQILKHFVSGATKYGILGNEFFETNIKLIDLSTPYLTDEAKNGIINLINEKMDKEGRSYKNAMKYMVEDGIFLLLPKREDAWVNFLMPFLKLTRNEKNRYINSKI